ncbi:tetraether lipid synthase Tes [Methanobrevibacter sp. DSM 116169]|uniref:tetraether lipid synthase Tes n=1 Tax=Methanobrevibacter sp. DSM 116169 TaxID=3242727 RepID=UPI0038FC7D0F
MKIKNTKSLCPVCFKTLDAEVYEADGKIRIKKECNEHGQFDNTYWSDSNLYHKMDKYTPTITHVENPEIHQKGNCPNLCGLCEDHETSTVLGLIDVTNRCNLKCPICFANAAVSKKVYEPSFEEIRTMLQNLRNLEPNPCPAIQYAGGEPTVRKDIVELVGLAKEEGFTHIQIATNGLKLASDEELPGKLKDAGLNTVYLSFDGVTEEPYIKSRNKNLLPQKLKAIENCRKAELGIVLVPTLVKGINDQQIGDIIKFAFENRDIVYGVNFQPVSFSGRTPGDQVEEQRITIPDFVNLVQDQTYEHVKVEDFYPPPAVEAFSKFLGALSGEKPSVLLNCHEHCGIATYVFIDEKEEGMDEWIPITRFIDVDKFLDLLDQYTDRLEDGGFAIKKRVYASAIKDILKVVHTTKAPGSLDISQILLNIFKNQSYEALGEFHKNAMLISCMHFMDPFNFDEDRVKKCVIHYAVPDGRIIPFCTLNSIYRERIEDEFSIPLEEYSSNK